MEIKRWQSSYDIWKIIQCNMKTEIIFYFCLLLSFCFQLYNAISDKVVGTLLRARKHGYVYFEGEMLYQVFIFIDIF